MPWWTITFWTSLLAVSAFAFARGGGPERAAAALLLSAAVATVLLRSATATRYSHLEVGVLAIDAALLAALAVVAVRSGRGWSVALTVLQAITVLGHLGKLLEHDLWRLGYAIMITGPAYPGLVALAIGTLQHRSRRTTGSSASSQEPSSNTRRASMRSGRRTS